MGIQRDDNDRQLKAAWLVVVEGAMALHMLHLQAFEQPRYRDGRFLKWFLASDHYELRRPITNTIRFDVQPSALAEKGRSAAGSVDGGRTTEVFVVRSE